MHIQTKHRLCTIASTMTMQAEAGLVGSVSRRSRPRLLGLIYALFLGALFCPLAWSFLGLSHCVKMDNPVLKSCTPLDSHTSKLQQVDEDHLDVQGVLSGGWTQ